MVDLRLRPLGSDELASLLNRTSVEPRLVLLPAAVPSVAVLRIGALGGSGGFTEPLRTMFLASFESSPNSLHWGPNLGVNTEYDIMISLISFINFQLSYPFEISPSLR